MILTETEKADLARILSAVPPRREGETDEEKTVRLDRHAQLIFSRVYHLQKAARELSDQHSELSLSCRADCFYEWAGKLKCDLDYAIDELGDVGAQYAFLNALSLAGEQAGREEADA